MKRVSVITSIISSGPATQSVEMLEKMMKAGMSVVRMNFSHGNYEVSESIAVNFAWGGHAVKNFSPVSS